MQIRELIDTASVPGGEELRLFRRGDEYIIAIGAGELMSSRMSGSEEALAVMSCERLRNAESARLLIGGYGMGFTLRAALAALGPDARVTVAELVPAIIDWARGPMAALAAGCLDDRRVELIVGDVAAAIAEGRGRYDAILLDVDNGPDGLTQAANDRLSSSGCRRPDIGWTRFRCVLVSAARAHATSSGLRTRIRPTVRFRPRAAISIIATLNLFGAYPLGTSEEMYPGESRGPGRRKAKRCSTTPWAPAFAGVHIPARKV